MTTYEAHELALVFPPMSEPEFAAFKEDIREHGQHEPILLYEGKILDGLHRYRACQDLGREPRVVRFEDNPRAAASLVLGRNFHRRHLTTSQRALLAAEMCKLRPRGNAGTSPYLTAAQASTLMSVGEDLVKDAKHLLRHGDEELIRSVRDGVRSVSAAIQEKKEKARFSFIEQFAQRLDRAIQGHSDRDAQVVYGAKPLLQYITIRIQDYLDPRTAEPLSGEDGTVLWDPSELKVPDWLYTDRGEGIATERHGRLAAVLPKAKEAAMGFPGERWTAAAVQYPCGRALVLRGLQGQRPLGVVLDARAGGDGLQQRPPLGPTIRLASRAGAAPATPALRPIADV
jgi:hypothetical protein